MRTGTHHRLMGLIFNSPQLVRDDFLDMAVQWANQAMSLSITNVVATSEASAASSSSSSLPERRLQAAHDTGVYVLPIYGALVSRSVHMDPCVTMTSYEQIRAMMKQAINDPLVHHIVLDIDSPGGSASGCFELADYIYQSRAIKPSTAVVNTGAYSASYALASAASEIVLAPSFSVGSIGVIARHLDLSERYKEEGVKITSIYAGSRKNDLHPAEPLSEGAAEWLTKLVNSSYEVFVDTVARNRGISAEAVKATEAGVFFGEEAIELKLADRLEVPEDAVERIVASVASQRSKPKRIATQAAAMGMACR